jgi:23S rRNA (guanine745-N1)-methyltransferase
MTTVDPAKEERLHQTLGSSFEAVVTEHVEYVVFPSRREALALVEMTPHRSRPARSGLQEHNAIPDRVTVSTLATVYRPR